MRETIERFAKLSKSSALAGPRALSDVESRFALGLRQARRGREAGLQLVQVARRDDGLSLIRHPSITSQACSAAVNVLNGEPTTLTAGACFDKPDARRLRSLDCPEG